MTNPDEAHENEKTSLKSEGRAKFDKAFFQAFWEEVSEQLSKKPMGLLSFDEVKSRLHLSDQSYKGLMEIPLERIVGSVGRYKDFTRKFLPKNADMIERWSNVYAQVNSLEGVPPIDVFEVDDVYFVRDGNHRVSIARQMGLKTIEAYVTKIYTPIDLEPDMTIREMDAAVEYARFLDKTRLDVSRPKQDPITLTEPGHYHNLIDHIHMIQQVITEKDAEPIGFSEAATHWYDTVYVPCVELIRKYNILEQFPKRTEADLYIWIIGHFQRLMDHYGTNSVRISEALVNFLGENHIPVPKRLLVEDDDPVI